MTAEVIQFVPKPNPDRDCRIAELAAAGLPYPVWPDFSTAAAYHAPDKALA